MENKTLRADRDNLQSTAEAREARLEERIGELEKYNFDLVDRIFIVEGKNAKFLERPSTSHLSEFPTIPREQYENGPLPKLT